MGRAGTMGEVGAGREVTGTVTAASPSAGHLAWGRDVGFGNRTRIFWGAAGAMHLNDVYDRCNGPLVERLGQASRRTTGRKTS